MVEAVRKGFAAVSVFHQMARDIVTVLHSDGSLVRENVRANVQAKSISIFDMSIPIEPGYIITRQVPSGIVEEFIVVDPGYSAQFHGIPAHYTIKYRRKDAVSRPAGAVYNVTGPNARINIGSYDASRNINFHAGSADELFSLIRAAISDGLESQEECEKALEAVAEMETALGTPTFVDRYTRFVGVVADHITLVAPFIPALTELLAKHVQ